MIFISVNTPTKNKGIGAGQASDLRWVEACAREVAQHAQGHTVVIEKSTLPVRTAAVIKAILDTPQDQSKNNLHTGQHFELLQSQIHIQNQSLSYQQFQMFLNLDMHSTALKQ